MEGRSRKSVVASFHSLRHTFVSISANAGVPLPVVQSIVGHCSTAMTQHYYHESENALRQTVEAIPAIGGWEEREEGNSLAAKATKAGTGGTILQKHRKFDTQDPLNDICATCLGFPIPANAPRHSLPVIC